MMHRHARRRTRKERWGADKVDSGGHVGAGGYMGPASISGGVNHERRRGPSEIRVHGGRRSE